MLKETNIFETGTIKNNKTVLIKKNVFNEENCMNSSHVVKKKLLNITKKLMRINEEDMHANIKSRVRKGLNTKVTG